MPRRELRLYRALLSQFYCYCLAHLYHIYFSAFLGPKKQKNKYGIDEPSNSNKIDLAKLDIILVPFLAFNKNLYRVGFGGGFYDKTLCRLSNLTKRV